MAFGIFLLVIGSGIRVFLIFTIIGLSLIALWLYFDARPKNQNKKKKCVCQICNHKVIKLCLQSKCPCCIAMKDNTCITHTNSSLQ